MTRSPLRLLALSVVVVFVDCLVIFKSYEYGYFSVGNMSRLDPSVQLVHTSWPGFADILIYLVPIALTIGIGRAWFRTLRQK